MTGDEDVEARLAAVERRLDDQDEGSGGTGAERVETFETRLAELEAAVEAIEGYVGELERIDRAFERRVDAALTELEELHQRVDDLDERIDALDRRAGTRDQSVDSPKSSATTGTPMATADDGPEKATTGSKHQQVESTAPTKTTEWDATGGRSAPSDGASAQGSGTGTSDPRSDAIRSGPGDNRPRAGISPDKDAAHTDGSGTDHEERCPSCGGTATAPRRDGDRKPDAGSVSGWGSDPDPIDHAGSRPSDPEESDPADSPTSNENGPDEWADETEERGLFHRLRERL